MFSKLNIYAACLYGNYFNNLYFMNIIYDASYCIFNEYPKSTISILKNFYKEIKLFLKFNRENIMTFNGNFNFLSQDYEKKVAAALFAFTQNQII